jgi:hypothetical protein
LDCAAKTGAVDCSKSIISLEFFANFLFQDKKLGRFRSFGRGATPSSKDYYFLSLFVWANVNSTKLKTTNNIELKSNQKAHHEYQIRPDSSLKASRPLGRISRISHHSWTLTTPESFKQNLLMLH